MKLRSDPLVCRDAIELMSNYLDEALSRRDQRRLTRHLQDCDACTLYLEQLRQIIAVSGSASPDDLTSNALEALVAVFRRFRDETDQS